MERKPSREWQEECGTFVSVSLAKCVHVLLIMSYYILEYIYCTFWAVSAEAKLVSRQQEAHSIR